eukprot:gnl/TRDRNA2_/TRDRNA2_193931_c0_seq1.p1 gnl/TRDRNA2_/TRDRNA2_193931_c0~~gnl/TRDRNA2_/TRDRNA2_193931_c0_seq1.p1  ORF type:complete len:351 (-),score=67.44 gnl/TRDRNA2_/TRDRNA2_193931_c0_seq1:136-1188(-)
MDSGSSIKAMPYAASTDAAEMKSNSSSSTSKYYVRSVQVPTAADAILQAKQGKKVPSAADVILQAKQGKKAPIHIQNTEKASSSWKPLLAFVAIAVLLAVAASGTWWYGPRRLLRAVLHMVMPAKPLWYHGVRILAATIFCIVAAIPVVFLLLPVPTMMFGFWPGYFLAFTALMGGALISFVIGRYFAQEPIRSFLERSRCEKTMRWLRVLESEQESLWLLVLYRFLFIPMAVKNYGPSILHVPLSMLAASAVPHSMWSAIVFSSAGAAFRSSAELLRDGQSVHWKAPQWQHVVGLGVGFVSAILFSSLAYRTYARKAKDEEQEPEDAPFRAENAGAGFYGTNASAAGQK